MGTKDVTLLPMGYLTDRASIFSHTVAPMRAEAGPPARTKVRPSDNCEDFFLLPKLEKHFYKKKQILSKSVPGLYHGKMGDHRRFPRLLDGISVQLGSTVKFL